MNKNELMMAKVGRKYVYSAFTKSNGKETFAFYTEDSKRATAWRMQDRENRVIHSELTYLNTIVTDTSVTEVEYL